MATWPRFSRSSAGSGTGARAIDARHAFQPAGARATLLHYVAANGVEGYRQLTPPNAVAIADALLDAGADVDALADMYGGRARP